MRFAIRTAASAALLFSLYCVLLCFPGAFFGASVRAGNLVLHSDRPLSLDRAQNVLRLAAAKLEASPLYSARQEHNIYLCNGRWRQRLFFTYNYGVGGVNYYPITRNVFLRDANVDDNRLISPRGMRVPGERTLDYFIAHEITHSLTGQVLGPWRSFRLPQWVREGYADYVGKGRLFDYAAAGQAFLTDSEEMNYRRSGLYRRFHLLVAYLLDQRQWSVERLLKSPPRQSSVEAQIRASVPGAQ